MNHSEVLIVNHVVGPFSSGIIRHNHEGGLEMDLRFQDLFRRLEPDDRDRRCLVVRPIDDRGGNDLDE